MDPSMRGLIVCGVPVGHPGFMEYHVAAKKSEVIEYIDTRAPSRHHRAARALPAPRPAPRAWVLPSADARMRHPPALHACSRCLRELFRRGGGALH